jgi:hypothetical protein
MNCPYFASLKDSPDLKPNKWYSLKRHYIYRAALNSVQCYPRFTCLLSGDDIRTHFNAPVGEIQVHLNPYLGIFHGL